AGLAAADTLAAAGCQVGVLEARRWAGGRLRTVQSASGLAIDVGAEFIHGSKVSTWEVIEKAGLATHEVPGKFWEFRDGKIVQQENFENPVSKLVEDV